MRDKSHICSQICHLSSFARERPDDSLMAMPLKSNSFFPYKDKYINVFERDAFSGCWLVCLSVGAELLFPWFVILAQWKSACPLKICIYSLATEICSKLALEIFYFNDFFLSRIWRKRFSQYGTLPQQEHHFRLLNQCRWPKILKH